MDWAHTQLVETTQSRSMTTYLQEIQHLSLEHLGVHRIGSVQQEQNITRKILLARIRGDRATTSLSEGGAGEQQSNSEQGEHLCCNKLVRPSLEICVVPAPRNL